MTTRNGVLLIVKNNEEKYLLLQHKKDQKWGFISGGIDIDEPEQDAIIREAQEETMLKISPDKIQKLPIIMEFETEEHHANYQWFLYDSKNEQLNFHPDNEIMNLKWLTEEEVKQKISDKPILLETFKKLVSS